MVNEVSACDQYCLFRTRNREAFAVLATSVREVMPVPNITPIPLSDPLLAGLCHVRNEFLPVVHSDRRNNDIREKQMMVMFSPTGPWGLLVENVLGLAQLEVSLNSVGADGSGLSAAVMGTASHEHEIIRVLDNNTLLQHFERQLRSHWKRINVA
ncbi:MAG: chemotaxis protein CheW [Pirellulaceae bacterium]